MLVISENEISIISVHILQIFVHCDVVVCDPRNPLSRACSVQCSNQDNGVKGMTSIIKQ